MVDFRIEWHQEPLKCEIILQNRGDVRDTILTFSCFLCDYKREGDIVNTMANLRQHTNKRHHFTPVNTTRIRWNDTHAGNRFVNKPGKGVQRRWACQTCPVYFKTKEELMEHFVPSHVPEDYKMPLSELDTVDTPPSSSSRSETEIDTPVSSLSLSSPIHAQSTTDSNEDDDGVFQRPLSMPTARPLRSSPRKDKGKGKLQEAPMQLPSSTARSKLAKEANEVRRQISKISIIGHQGHRSSSGRNLASTDDEERDTTMVVDTTVAREDHGTQTELEDTAMVEETLVTRVDQAIQTESEPQPLEQMQEDVPMSVEPENAMISSGATSQIAQDPVILSSDSSASKDVVDTTMEQSEAIESATLPQELKDTGPDKEALKQDPGKDEVSKTTGLTAIQEDSIVAKLIEAIKKKKEEARREVDKKKQDTGSEKAETKAQEQSLSSSKKQAVLSDPPSSSVKQQVIISDPSSSRSHLKRPLERSSDSDHSEKGSEKVDNDNQGVPGVTASLQLFEGQS